VSSFAPQEIPSRLQFLIRLRNIVGNAVFSGLSTLPERCLVQINSVTGIGGQAPPPSPLVAAAKWPVRAGIVPSLADRFDLRPETGPNLGRALEGVATVALIPQPARNDSGLTQRWLRTCGKTQLAVAFAETQWQARAIDLLLWIDGSSTASVLAGYADGARAVTRAPTAGPAGPVATSLLAWLAQSSARWLVVLDDVHDGRLLEGLIPSGSAGHVIITGASSQAVAGVPDALVVEIGPFSPREAMKYLVGRLSNDSDQRRGAMDLIRDVGCQPAALAHSIATIASSWITCDDYCEQFRRRQDRLGGPGDQAAAAVTWRLALDRADQMVPGAAARYCLAFAGMLDGHGIPVGLFGTSAARQFIVPEHSSPGLPGQPGPAAGHTQLALTSLERVGLLSIDGTEDFAVVRVSPALQRSMQAAMRPDLLAQSAEAAGAALLEFWPPGDQSTQVAQLARGSAVALLRADRDALWAGGCPAVLMRAGQSVDGAGMPGAAVDYWRELSAASDRVLGPDHPDSLRLADLLGASYSAAGLHAEAIASRQRVADQRARTLGPQHSLTLAGQVALSRSLLEAGDFGTAVNVLATALATSEAQRGASDPEVLGIRDRLAAAYLAAGRATDATRVLKTTLAERERSAGPTHNDTIETRQLLAEACVAAGKLKDAVSLYRRAVDDSARLNGPEHRATLRARGALAGVYQQTGKIANAVSMYELTRESCARALGPDDPDTLMSCVSLARMYFAVGHVANATTLLRDTLDRCERALPPGDPITRLARESLTAVAGP
jgi:tetratricopeptide (TPR) repeat protein